MSGLKNFAVAGSGNIGKVIAEELVREKEAGENTLHRHLVSFYLKSKGTRIVAVDYTSSASLESALAGTDVVISSLPEGFDETIVAIAAKAAGVKLFVPSDYAVGPSEGHEDDPLFTSRVTSRRKLKELQLPHAVFWPGLFHDMALAPLYGRDWASLLERRIYDSGFRNSSYSISWATSNDTARFVAYALINLPREKLEWRAFPIEGDRASFNDIVASWEKRTGKTCTVSHRSHSELEEDAKKNPDDMWPPFFMIAADEGKMVVGNPSVLANHEFPEWKPKKIIEVLAEIYEQ